MDYKQSVSECADILRMILPRLGEHDLAANPVNYTVWFEYFAATLPDLVAAVDARLAAGQALDAQALDDLYRRYVAGTGADELQAVRADMLAIMARIGESVASVDGQASTLDHSLNALTPHLDRVAGVDGLIADLGRETSRMLAVNSRLRQRLDRSTEEMDDLRRELERARAEARIDPLTGLANRAGFDQAMGRAISESAASGEAFCVLLLDIDRFKSINDTHGHLLGDKVIRVIADIIRKMVRGGDTAGRLGGDEFAVILPNTPVNGAAIVGEKIRSAMAQARIRRVDNQSSLGKVTLSIGVAGLRAGETITDLVERADAALYQAKRRGRNRVCTEAETG